MVFTISSANPNRRLPNIKVSPIIGYRLNIRDIIGMSFFFRITMSRIAKRMPTGKTKTMQRITGITSIPIVPATKYVNPRQQRLRIPKGIF